MAKAATLLVTGLLLAACNTVAGLKTDLGLAGNDQPGTVQPPEVTQSGSSTPPAVTENGPASRPEVQYATVVHPGELRDAPSTDGKVVGYASVGDTYQVFDRRGDWMRIGADGTPVAWIVATLLTAPPSPAGVPPQ